MTIPATYAEVGPMITGGDLEDATMNLLQDWLPGYLAEGERQHGIPAGTTPPPRSWTFTGRNLQKLNTDQLPCVVIMSGGLANPPRKEGAPGTYTATWALDIATIIHTAWAPRSPAPTSRRQAQAYAAAIRTLLEQRPLTVGSRTAAVDWRGEVYDELDIADTRSYSASVAMFNVQLRDVLRGDGGPPPQVAPPTDPTWPFLDWPIVEETDTTIEPLEAPA